MLLLLAFPIFLAVTAVNHYLGRYAPTNLLVRRVRTSPARWRTVVALAILAVSCCPNPSRRLSRLG